MKFKTNNGPLDIKVVIVTPAVAKSYLHGCPKNRTPTRNRIKRYKQAMDNGEWQVAQPILFDKEDKLLDGQHRMHSVIAHGGPVEFIKISGFDRIGIFGCIDDVGKRTLADWLDIEGVNLPRICAGVVMMASRDLAGKVPTGSGGAFIVTPIEGLEFYHAHPEIAVSVKAPGTVNTLVPRAMCCFAHWKFAQVDTAAADDFFVDLAIGELEGEFDPIFHLRERMKTDRVAKRRMGKSEKLALVFKAWNFIRTNTECRQLRWRSDGPGAEAFPEVV